MSENTQAAQAAQQQQAEPKVDVPVTVESEP